MKTERREELDREIAKARQAATLAQEQGERQDAGAWWRLARELQERRDRE